MIRLIAIDVDGTLLDSRGRIPDDNLRALAESAARGVEILVATGRSYQFCRPVVAPLPPATRLLVSNGALVKDMDGATFLKRLLRREVAQGVLDMTQPYRDMAALIFDRDEAEYIIVESMDWQHPNRKRYYERNRASIGLAAPLESAITEDPIQIMFNGGVEPMRALLEILRALPSASQFEVALTEYPERDFSLLDVMAAGCSKGATLETYATARGYARDEVMAVGDNFNDVQMLEYAGVPVVMGNASDDLKARGWHVTAHHDEAGLARAIERFVL